MFAEWINIYLIEPLSQQFEDNSNELNCTRPWLRLTARLDLIKIGFKPYRKTRVCVCVFEGVWDESENEGKTHKYVIKSLM